MLTDAQIFWRQVNKWYKEKGRGFILAIEDVGSMTYHALGELADMPLDAEQRAELDQQIHTYNPKREAVMLDIRATGYGQVRLLYKKDEPPTRTA